MQHITVSCFLLVNIITFQIGTCEGFEFLLVFGNVFPQCQRDDENIKYTAKKLFMINKYGEDAKRGYGPATLYFNIGGFSKIIGNNAKGNEILEFFDVLNPGVISLNKPNLNTGSQLLNRTTHTIDGIEAQETEDNLFKEAMNPVRVFKIINRKIGVIDYTLDKTDQPFTLVGKTSADKIEFVKQEALKLQKLGVNIIIAIGDGDFDLHEAVSKTEHVDIVIGDAKNIWLKMQNQNSSISSTVNITEMHECESIKYLEKLTIESDEEGVIWKFQKKSIFLDDGVPELKVESNIFKPVLREQRSEGDDKWLGDSVIELQSNCKSAECSLGNMVTDAMCYYESEKKWSNSWTKYPIAFATDIFKANLPTKITRGAINKAISNVKVSYLTITGKELEDFLNTTIGGVWTQMSGIYVYYNVDGKKIKMYTRVRCGKCNDPFFRKLDYLENYSVMMDYDTAHSYFNKAKISQGPPIRDMVVKYIADHNFTYHHVEERYLKVGDRELEDLKRSECSKLYAQVSGSYLSILVFISSLNL